MFYFLHFFGVGEGPKKPMFCMLVKILTIVNNALVNTYELVWFNMLVSERPEALSPAGT